jgi:hypothetical protein
MADSNVVHAEDVVAVRSRISWGAVLGGAVLALALYFLLTLLGSAVGFTIGDKYEARHVANGAAVYALVITAVCLFVGGFVAAQLTTGENKQEAALYGLLVWAVVFAMMVWLMATGVKAGFGALMGIATAGTAVVDKTAQNTTQADTDRVAQQLGFTPQQIEEARARVRNAPADAKAAAENPETRAKAEQAAHDAGEAATRVTWYAFLGAFVSMLLAAVGGYCGAGPTFRLFPVVVDRGVAPRPRLGGV